ncbi:Thioredoxin-1 [Caulifigura coniformis]|uniref:Thioredoxin-1 n=1 Tax=Caulifigura coniformis TaxID=2527983 RepID=A0A517SK42_9PLAN|nr:thioredoxin domain-containing protein [Caulifigura coniformis]QDT56494.1 Thioredoxin-1 [Caulifigura coniformis]
MLSRSSFAFALIAVVSACCSAQADEWLTDLEKAKQLAREQDRAILVHFYADWCGPCKNMERNVLHTSAVQQALGKDVIGVLVNVSEHPQLGDRFGVEKFPTDIFIEPSGKHIVKSEGQKTVKEFTDSIARASARYNATVATRTPKATSPAVQPSAGVVSPSTAEPMLLGYCPVTLSNRRKWEKGVPQYAATFQGQTYHMATEESFKDFQQNPGRYAPQFLGCDPVLVAKTDRAVLGSTRFAAFYDDVLYLFSSDDTRKQFKSDPDKFIREKVVLDLDQIETVTK